MPFTTVDPVTGAIKASYDYVAESGITDAVARLHGAHLNWKKLDAAARQTRLRPLAGRIRARREEIAALITAEMGKTLTESRAEVDKCAKTAERACELDLAFLDPREAPSAYAHAWVVNEPLGVLYSIMPWNYPLWQAIRMVIPALLAGNVILLKHSEITPLTGALLEELFAGLFEAPLLLNRYVEHEKTEFVMADPRVGGASLTGSIGAGKKVYAAAAAQLKKVVLELGGSDPYLVLDDADPELAVKTLAKGRLQNCGQTCIAVKRALIPATQLPDYLERLKKEFDQYSFGSPADEKTSLGPLAHPRFKDALKKQLADFVAATGAEKVYSRAHGQSDASAFVNAEIYVLKKNSDWLKSQEIFAPVLVVIPYASENEAVEIANSTDFALGAGVFSRDAARAERVAARLVAGHVAINGIVSSDLSLPFGGFKSSGLGRELGRESFTEFTLTKAITRA